MDTEELFASLVAGNNRYRDMGENRVGVELNVQFAHNSSRITSDFDSEIARAAAFLAENPGVVASVEGHADSTGEDTYNQWLSERRAAAVRQMMIDKHGVSPAQITSAGYGETRPIADNSTPEGRSQNRRVELVLDGNAGSQ